MTLQDIVFHLPRGEAEDSNLFIAKSFRMVEAAGLEPALPGWPVSVNLPKLAPENGRDYRTRTCIAAFGALLFYPLNYLPVICRQKGSNLHTLLTRQQSCL